MALLNRNDVSGYLSPILGIPEPTIQAKIRALYFYELVPKSNFGLRDLFRISVLSIISSGIGNVRFRSSVNNYLNMRDQNGILFESFVLHQIQDPDSDIDWQETLIEIEHDFEFAFFKIKKDGTQKIYRFGSESSCGMICRMKGSVLRRLRNV